MKKRLREELQSQPVFISEQLIKRYYENFSNRTIWPLFHSFPAYVKYALQDWEAYQKVNYMFCKTVIPLIKPNDIIWVHDYHLMLLPKLLRERIPNIPIGFFLHIPFPHFDIFRILPQHREILDGLMGADLIGFHTYEYAHSFLVSVRRTLGYDNTIGQILLGDRIVQADVFPMGIDFSKYSEATESSVVQDEIAKIKEKVGERKLVFSVSRQDYTKGIPNTIDAIAKFLEKHPEWHQKITFMLIVVPSRGHVDHYMLLKTEIDRLVGKINSQYGTLDWMPIIYIYRSLSFEELAALYASADVGFIIPLRDGMNLIAKEYLAVKNDGGVLILSDMAGAARELLEAIIVNPYDTAELVDALIKALQMPVSQQEESNKIMRARLKTYDICWWVERFLERLDEVIYLSKSLSVKFFDEESKQEMKRKYNESQFRLILLDYDGTLVPFSREPGRAAPDDNLIDLLQKISSPSHNEVVILSGRDRHTLEKWFGYLNVALVAEHGGWVRTNPASAWTSVTNPIEEGWKKEVRPIFNLFFDRIPCSFVEEKDYSLVWHYRMADLKSSSIAAKELLDVLTNLTANLNIRVLPGNKTVEVRNSGVSKGIFFSQYLLHKNADFILAAGDDWTDEDLFAALPDSSFSIKVGIRASRARFSIRSYRDMRALLSQLED